MTYEVHFINPSTMAAPPGYTHVVEVIKGRMVYISGQVALDAAGNVVGQGDLGAQAVQVFENIKAALAAVGADFSHVIKLNSYLVDFSQAGAIRNVRDRYINPAQPPASTAVQVSRLFREEFLIEIEAVAVIPENGG